MTDVDKHNSDTAMANLAAENDRLRQQLAAAGKCAPATGCLAGQAWDDLTAERDAALLSAKRWRDTADSVAAENARLRQDVAALTDALTTHTDLLDEARRERDHVRSLYRNVEAAWSAAEGTIYAMRPVVEAAEAWRTWFGGLRTSSMFIPENELANAVDAYRAGQKVPETAPESRQDDEQAEVVPEWQYATTQGPRKAWDGWDTPPDGEGWERDLDKGDNGWERFDYHEESYWRRPIPTETDQAAPITADPPGLDAAIEAAFERINGLGGQYRAIAGLAVRAAAPALRAGALREAADDFARDWRLPGVARALRERADRIGCTA